MTKKLPNLITLCEAITKYSIYAVVFLLPIFFLPWTSNVLDFNKQTLLVLLSFVAMFAWMVKALVSGKLSLVCTKVNFAVLFFVLVLSGSTIFSLDKYGSFWGWPRVSSESLITIICFAFIYFLISNVFSKQRIVSVVKLLGLSASLAILIGVFQLFGIFLPFDFAKTASFNTVGMVGGLGLFMAVLLPVFIVFEIYGKKWEKIVFAITIGLSVIALVLINYTIVWWIALASSALFILFAVVKRDLFDLRWLGIPMFFAALALFFIVLQFQLPTPEKPLEVYLKQSVGFEIAKNTLKESSILGSGPGTFSYDFSKHRNANSIQGALWNLRFDSAGSKALTVLATTGVLGFLAFLALVGTALFYGVRFMLEKKPAKDNQSIYFSVFSLVVLVGVVSQVITYFVYGSNLTFDFLFFFLIACFVGLTTLEKKEITLKPSSMLTLFVTFTATISFIFGLGVLVLDGQRYVAEIYHTKGIRALSVGQVDKSLQNLERSVSLNSNADIYLTRLSETYLLNLTRVVQDESLSDEDKSRITKLMVNNSVNAAKLATDVSPNNSSNWFARGFAYQNLIGTIAGAEDWALSSYEQAFLLDPKSPIYPTQKGIVYMAKANISEEESENLNNAKKEFGKALELKPDYAPAHYQLGVIYYQEKDFTKAIEKFEQVAQLNPNNEQIQAILQKLRAENTPIDNLDDIDIKE